MNGDTGILVGAGGGAAVDVGGGLGGGTGLIVNAGGGGVVPTTGQVSEDVRGRIPVWSIFAFIVLLGYYATRDYHYGKYRD